MSNFTPKPMGKLLLTPNWWSAVTDHSREWITDGCVIARADCFTTRTKTELPPGKGYPRKQVTDLLTRARHLTPDGAPVYATDWCTGDPYDPAVVLTAGNSLRLLRAKAWTAWNSTGCVPTWVDQLSVVTWRREINARMVVVGVTAGMRPHRGLAFRERP